MRPFRILTIISLLCVLAIPLSAQDATPTLAPLPGVNLAPFELIDLPETPPELNLNDTLSVRFSYALDCSTVEAGVILVPVVEGTWDCDGDTLSFTPTDGYAQQTAYSVRFTQNLKTDDTRDGKAVRLELPRPMIYRFSTPGFLRVTDVLPAPDTVEVHAASDITVIFNRPIVPLVIVEEMDDLPQPLTFDPPIEGEGEWLNTFIYTFVPSPFLEAGTTYTVTINDDLQSADDAQLAETFSWEFSTAAPQLVRVSPRSNADNIPIEQTFSFTFNLPIEQDLLEDNFYLRPTDFPDDYNLPGTWDWDEEGLVATFTPDYLLNLESIYAAGIHQDGLLQDDDRTAFEGQTDWTFTTLPYPRLQGTVPGDDTVTYSYSGFGIDFNTFMDAESITERMTITPEPEAGTFRGYRSRFSYQGSFPAQPSTTYNVVVEPGYSDIYGNVVNERIEFTYTTDRYSAAMNLAIPGGAIGFYNAYYDQTGLYVQHRNIDKIGVELYQLPIEEFMPLLQDGTGYGGLLYDYIPPAENLLRSGVVTLDSPENAYVPSFIVPGNDNITCGIAPESRLTIGGTAEIISESVVEFWHGQRSPDDYAIAQANRQTYLDGLQDADASVQATATARAELPITPTAMPPTAYLYRGLTMEIIGAPACYEEQLWWRVRLEDGTTGWIAENTDADYALAPVNLESSRVLVNNSGDTLTPGIYYLSVNIVEPPRDNSYRNHYMMVMTSTLLLKTSFNEVMVWATDVHSGKPIANEPITVYNSDGIIAAGLTDENGLLQLDIPQMESLNREGIYAVLNTDRHLGIGASYWSDGISPGNYQMPTEFNREDHDIYIYTDRSVFRPGETVHYRGVVRQRDDMRYLPVEQDTVTVTFNNGEEVKTEEFELTPFGTFSGSFDIVDEAPLGAYYRLEAELMTEDSSAVEIERSVSFAVAEFVPPEFEAEVIPQQDEYVQGETMQIAVDSSYFFGGKVADARVFYRVQAEPYTFNYQGQGRYSFFSYDPYDYRRDDRYGRGTRVAEGAGTSDSNGVYMLELPAELQFDDSSNRIIIEASVRDDSNREINVRGGVIVHAGEIYIGSQPQEYIGNAGRESSIDLIAVDLDSEPVPNQELRVEAVQVKWNNIQERDDLGRTVWTWEEELIPVSDALLTTDENGKAVFTFTPEDGGTYRVVSTTMDSNGNPVSNIANQWVRGSSYVSWRQSNNKRIDLIAGSDNYSVGDTAEILIASPFQGTAQALITVERQGVITHEVITLENNSYVYELPIEEDFAPNIFVSVFVVKGVDDNNPVADFRMGMLQLDVDIEQKIITLDVSADTERAAPQDTVTYTIVATDYNGDPVQAEIGVGVTDRAALAVGAPAGDPMAEHYYSNVGLSVRTATPLTINTDAITQQIIDTLKGGGGGGGGLPFTFEVRGEFVNTPFWEGTVLTDENGEAKVEVTLPDNLTTWRLDARAVTTGEDGITKIGQTTFDLISTRPLLVRPVAPRFFVVGDVMTISAVVNNNTPDDIEATVLLEASGIRLLDESSQTQTITIPADRGKRVDWQVEVLDADSVELIFATESLDGDYNDASRPTLGEGENNLIPIYKYEARETVATGGVIREEGTRTETILLPERYTTNDANLTVTVESSLAAGLEDSLDYLDTYDSRSIPYVVSRFLPNLMTYRALQSLDIENAPMKLRLDETLSWALQRLYNEQKSDGGWGWYLNESSDTNTTAYVLIALGEARKQGFTISQSVINRAQDYLREQFITPSLSISTYRLNRQAFLLYAMARSGSPDVARNANLFEFRDVLNIDAQVFLAMSLHLSDPDNTDRTDVLLANFVSNATFSATGAHWEEQYRDRWNWSSDTRSTALVLHALTQLTPDSELIPQAVRWLMVARQGRSYWYNTQETAWAVMALTDWMLLSGELQPDYSYRVTWNGDDKLLEAVMPANYDDSETFVIELADMLLTENNELTFDRTDGTGVMYYTARLNVTLPVPEIQALDRGIIIRRQYYAEDDVDMENPITEARVGDNVRVRLSIIAPDALHYVTIEDPLPAGAEAIDPRLPTSRQLGANSVFTRNQYYGWGWWYLKQREFKDEMVRLHASYLPSGTYEFVYSMRPGLPGTYNVMPPYAEENYFPEVFGRGEGMSFTILSADDSDFIDDLTDDALESDSDE